MSDNTEWSVYEHAAGTTWRIHPPTEECARREAGLMGEGWEPMLRNQSEAMGNAWATGRMAGIELMRAHSEEKA